MNSSEDVIQVLGNLDEKDREWILKRLSPAARSTLLDTRQVGSPVPTTAGRSVADDSRRLNKALSISHHRGGVGNDVESVLGSARASAIAAVLRREPPWVVHATTRCGSSWCDEVMRMLPTAVQMDVGRLESLGVKHSSKLTAFLRSRLAGYVGDIPAADERSAFDKLVSTLGATLMRKRMGIRA